MHLLHIPLYIVYFLLTLLNHYINHQQVTDSIKKWIIETSRTSIKVKIKLRISLLQS